MGHIKRSDLDSAMVLVPSNGDLKNMCEQMDCILQKVVNNNNQIRNLNKLKK